MADKRIKFNITMEGDTEPTLVTVKPRHMLASERDEKAGEDKVEGTYRLAWYASESNLDFESWMKVVDDVEGILPEEEKDDEKEDGDIPPTTPDSASSRAVSDFLSTPSPTTTN